MHFTDESGVGQCCLLEYPTSIIESFTNSLSCIKEDKHRLKENNKRCKSLWKNVEPHSSTILEDEKLNSFL